MHNPVTCRVSGTILASVVSWSKKPDLSGLVTIQYNTIQYKFYCQLPTGVFQGQILIIQIIKKYSKIVNKQLFRNYLHIKFMTLQIDLKILKNYQLTIKKLFACKIYDIKNWFKKKAFILRLKMIRDSLNLIDRSSRSFIAAIVGLKSCTWNDISSLVSST